MLIIMALEGPSRHSLDYYLEKKIRWWKKLAEFGKSSASKTNPSTPMK
jgi:hypothetical protein